MKEAAHSRHPNYLLIAVLLAVLTAIEVATSYTIAEPVRIPLLLFLALCKGGLVALYYMHLRFDSRIFSFFFAAGIFILAVPFALVLLLVQTPLIGLPR